MLKLIIFYAIIINILLSCDDRSIVVEKTSGKDAEWHKSYFMKSNNKIIIGENDVKVFTNNGIMEINKQQPRVVNDRHSRVEYRLLSTTNNSATIEYFSEFDHRSFGRDILTQDAGSFTISSK